MPTERQKTCVICKNMFNSKSNNAKYCIDCLTFKCKECEKIFTINGNKILNKNLFCSKSCRATYNIRKKLGEEWTEHLRECGKKGGKLSKRTFNKEEKEKLKMKWIGKNNPNYKHGKSKEWKKRYYDSKYKNWRKKVFERDNYTCQMCGAEKCYLTAHHIKSWANHEKLRYKIINGQTLCEECHKKTDNYKGRNKYLTKTL